MINLDGTDYERSLNGGLRYSFQGGFHLLKSERTIIPINEASAYRSLAQFDTTGSARSARVVLAAAAWTARPAFLSRSAQAALAVKL